MMETTDSVLRLIYIILGFSLIIFLHELGHFVVARACSVKCLAFSIGIGPRMLGWRKGGKLSFGNDPYDPETKSKDKKDGKSHGEVEKVEAATTQSDLPTTAVAPPHPAAVGDCDYRVSWLPLGGYVRMLGQDDMDPTKVSTDPRAFNMRPIWQRMCIVSAGVIMNVIFAAVAFSIIFSVGIDFPPAVIGGTEYGSPADKAGLRLGDRVVEIDGEKPTGFVEFTDLQIAAALAKRDAIIDIGYLRPGVEGMQHVKVSPMEPAEGGLMRVGVEYMPSTRIVKSKSILEDAVKMRGAPEAEGGANDKAGQEELKKLLPHDIMVTVDGISIADDPKAHTPRYPTLYEHLQEHGAATPVKLGVVDAKGGNPRELTIRPLLQHRRGVSEYPTIAGLGPRLIAEDVAKGGPADKGGMKPGDVIVRVGERLWPTVEKFKEIVSGRPGSALDIEVLRNGKRETLTVTPEAKAGKGRVQLALGELMSDTAVAVRERGLDVTGISDLESTRIVAVDNTPVTTWNEIYDQFKRHKGGDSVKLTFAPAAAGSTATEPAAALDLAKLPTATVTVSPELAGTLQTQLHYVLDVPVENYMEPQVATNAGQAVVMGGEHTKKFILQVYSTLRGLFLRTVPADNLHGIVGITKIGYDVQERGPIWLWYVLAMVSVNLAVANFLPLPIVDGGLFLLLILEKIRGKPLSLKVQSAIQVVGIVLLGGLFLFVTWNDIGLFTK